MRKIVAIFLALLNIISLNAIGREIFCPSETKDGKTKCSLVLREEVARFLQNYDRVENINSQNVLEYLESLDENKVHSILEEMNIEFQDLNARSGTNGWG